MLVCIYVSVIYIIATDLDVQFNGIESVGCILKFYQLYE